MTQSTEIIKTFECKISDPFDDYPRAVVAIEDWAETTKSMGRASKESNRYDLSEIKEGLSYSAVMWNSPQTKAAGKLSRDLMGLGDDGKVTVVFPADLEHPESQQIMGTTMNREAKILAIIQKDVIRRNR